MNRIEKIISENWNIIKLVGLILSVVVGYTTFDSYISNQIEKQITSASYLERLSKSLRPFLIFNGDGKIVYDHGVAEMVKGINVDSKEEVINVEFTKYVQNPPLIIVIGANVSTYKSERGGNFSWVFKNTTGLKYTDIWEPPKKEDIKYIMEILK